MKKKLKLETLIKKMPYEIEVYNEDHTFKNKQELLKEAEYVKSLYYEGGHCNRELFDEDPKEWRREVKNINLYIKLIKDNS